MDYDTHSQVRLDLTENRYANMDYVFSSAIKSAASNLKQITVSYDIACQWSKKLKDRMEAMPASIKISSGIQFRYKVPKFHLPCHVKQCWTPYAFNYTKWVGMTDGEGVERMWSWLNGVARSLSVMSFGSRSDTMDDYCNYYNWKKTIGLGKCSRFYRYRIMINHTDTGDHLLEKMAKAIPRAITHYRAFRIFSKCLAEGYPQEVKEWEKQVRAWENDQTLPCPYEIDDKNGMLVKSLIPWLKDKHIEITLASVKNTLAAADNQKCQAGNLDSYGQELTSSQFVILGLEVEELQYVFPYASLQLTKSYQA